MSETLRPEMQQRLPEVHFTAHKLVEVEPATQDAAEQAIAFVWKQHMQGPTELNLMFASHLDLELDDGTIESINSVYEPESDRIIIALDTLRERHPESTVEVLTVLHAGHEARHKVQEESGDPAPRSRSGIAHGTYTDSRHEIEAWESAVEAFSAMYPGRWVEFTVGSYVYSTRQY